MSIKLQSLLIFFLCFLNFQFNFFKVVSTDRFEKFEVSSEKNVLDGILNYRDNGGELMLGQFSRPNYKDKEYKPREFFKNKIVDGEFTEYKSQFGLQVKFFGIFTDDLFIMQSFSSFIFSLIISLIFFLLSKNFSNSFAIIFTLVLVLNPWITPIARNTYWVIGFAFLPFLVTLYFAEKIHNSKKFLFLMLITLYISFLVKFLMGYEFITSIIISSFIPLIHYSFINRLNNFKLLNNIFYILTVSVLSFFSSIFIYVSSLNEENKLDFIYLTAEKRLMSKNPKKTAYDTCFSLYADENGFLDTTTQNNRDCLINIESSLSASPISVVSKYFIFKNLIPWLGSFDLELEDYQEKELKSIYYSNEKYIQKAMNFLDYTIKNFFDFNFLQLFSQFINYIISPILFLIIMILSYKYFLIKDLLNKILIISIFLPPLSWFIIGKGHSFIHTHLNFILWYLPTIPYLMAIVFSKKQNL